MYLSISSLPEDRAYTYDFFYELFFPNFASKVAGVIIGFPRNFL